MATSGRPRQVPGARRHLLPLRLQPNRWPHAVARGRQAQRFAKIGDRAFPQIWKADERCVRRFPDLAHRFDVCSPQSAAIAAGARAIRVRRSSRSCSVNAGREVDDPNRVSSASSGVGSCRFISLWSASRSTSLRMAYLQTFARR